MPDLNRGELERYLTYLFGRHIEILGLAPLGGEPKDTQIKGYGYGTPVRIDFLVGENERRTAVLHTMSPGPFGHEHMSDRAQELLWEHTAFNRLPRHVRSLDVGGFETGGKLLSLGKVEEFCLFTEYVEGKPYFLDLERLRDGGNARPEDRACADALCDYLVQIHDTKRNEPELYLRRVRELVGSGECIMGLTDCYAGHPFFPAQLLEDIEHRAVRWRWRLKDYTHRLCQVHGDFHPWNILFRSDSDFGVLDRSRGEYGDAADDVTSLTLNYFFFSLQRSGKLEGPFEKM